MNGVPEVVLRGLFPVQSSPNLGRRPMKDMQAHLEKLRVEAEECELISKLATNKTKKELFAKLAAHHRTLADEVERTMKEAR